MTRLDLSMRRWSLIAYTLGMALYTLVVVALYPAFKTSTSLDDLIRNQPTAAALFGVSGSLSSSSGWLNGNIYANFFPLVMLLVTVAYGAASLAGQDEDGTLAMVVALPTPRTSIVLAKAAALAVQAALLAAVVAICVLVGRSFELAVTPGNAIGVSLTVFLLGVDFGVLTMAVGAYTGRRGLAIGIGASLAAASYLVSSLAPVVSWLRPARYASLFYWAVGGDQISLGVSVVDYAVLAAAGCTALGVAVVAFRHFDVH